jgi:hypothetical protein
MPGTVTFSPSSTDHSFALIAMIATTASTDILADAAAAAAAAAAAYHYAVAASASVFLARGQALLARSKSKPCV